MKCPKCEIEVRVITEVVTSYTAKSHTPRGISKLIFSKLVQCPNCKRIDLLTVNDED